MAKRRYSHILGGVTSNSLVARFLAILQCDKFYEILRAKALRMTRVERGGKMPIYLFPAEHIRIASFTMVGSNIYPPLRMTSVERGGKVPNIYPRGDRREFDSFMKKAAFTLVEVLIVIGVIGIVAALTIPNLLQKYTERQNIIKLQRVYALLQQATRSMVAEHGELHTWADDSRVFFENEFMKRVKVIDKNTTYNEIVSSSGLGWDNLIPTLELLDGTVVRIRSRIKNDPAGSYHTCNTSVNHASSGYSIHYGSCAYIRVDINGKGKPNKAGQDIFEFRVYTDGVLPKGIAKSGSNDSFKECYSGTNDNLNCTAWVIENKNMDYLRCRDDLSWTENRSCPKK